jgi:hypothetical protein
MGSPPRTSAPGLSNGLTPGFIGVSRIIDCLENGMGVPCNGGRL